MTELLSLAPDTPMASAISVVERDGGVILTDFLAPHLVAALNGELDDSLATKPPGSRNGKPAHQVFHGHNTKRICGLAARAPSFVELLLDDRFKQYADHFLLPNCGEYWLNTGQLMAVGPGEPAQVLHRDDANWPHFPWPHAEVTVSAMIALSPFTAENGATWVVPGSHHWERGERFPQEEEACQALMAPGDALLYTGKLFHGAGENMTQDWRRGLHVSFVLGWLRAEEAHSIQVPLDVARRLPPRARALLGYDSYHPKDAVSGGRLGLVDFDDAAFYVNDQLAS